MPAFSESSGQQVPANFRLVTRSEMRRPKRKSAAKTGSSRAKSAPKTGPKKLTRSDRDLRQAREIRSVFGHFRKASGGCDGGVVGHNGSMTPFSLVLIFQFLGVCGRRLVDLGCGEGRVLASALMCGAEKVYGHELSANRAHKFVFDAVLVRMARAVGSSDTSVFSRNAQWLEDDIDKVFEHQNRRFRSDLYCSVT